MKCERVCDSGKQARWFEIYSLLLQESICVLLATGCVAASTYTMFIKSLAPVHAHSIPFPYPIQKRPKKVESERPSDLPRPYASLPRHAPRLGTHLLCLRVRPRVRPHADAVVDGRVRGLVHQRRAQGRHRVHAEAGLDAAVQAGEGVDEGLERPLPGDGQQGEDQVDDLQGGEGLDGRVEGFGQEVPEDLRPEEAFERGGQLVDGRREDDEARPVVFDQFAHRERSLGLFGGEDGGDERARVSVGCEYCGSCLWCHRYCMCWCCCVVEDDVSGNWACDGGVYRSSMAVSLAR